MPPSLVAELRRRSDAVWVNWFCDERRTPPRSRPSRRAYDLVFVAGSEVVEAGTVGLPPLRYLPPGCDPSVHRPMRSRDQFRANVVFAGTATPHRERMLSELVEFGLALWGPGWRKTKLRDYCRGELLDHGDYIRAYAGASVAVNVQCSEQRARGSRAATGGCSSWPRSGCRRWWRIRPDLERHFREGSEILVARSAAEFKVLTRRGAARSSLGRSRWPQAPGSGRCRSTPTCIALVCCSGPFGPTWGDSAAAMTLTVMQVLHQGGGAGSVTSTLHLSLGLARAGVGVRFVCPPDSEVEALARAGGLEVLPLALDAGRRQTNAAALAGLLARYPVDLVNSQSARDREALVRLWPSAAGSAVPLVLTRRQMPRTFFLENWLASLARRSRDRGESGGGRVAPPQGNAGRQAGRDSQRSGHRAGGSPADSGRGGRPGGSAIGWDASAPHHRHRGTRQGPEGGPRALSPGSGHRSGWCSRAWSQAARWMSSRARSGRSPRRRLPPIHSRRATALRAAGARAAALPHRRPLPIPPGGDGAG